MTERDLLDKIDDYSTSIHAIVGFANFYLWDATTNQDYPGVIVFQGRQLRPVATDDEGNPVGHGPAVTPDLGVFLPTRGGVLAEIKLSFPRNEEHWMDDFNQLMSYDAELEGWPSADGKVVQHDVVLVTDQGRGVPVKKFYEQRLGNEIKFDRPFSIVVCNRSDNRQPYYFFQRTVGVLSDAALDARLEIGVKVPMNILVAKYSTVKLYDAKPPLAYLLEVIWSQVIVDAARQDPKFEKLRKRQKLPIVLQIEEIVQSLRNGFTFRSLEANAPEGAPAVPHRNWVVEAMEQLVSMAEAEWIDATKNSVRVFFQRHENVLDHFVKSCCKPPDPQIPLAFSDE